MEQVLDTKLYTPHHSQGSKDMYCCPFHKEKTPSLAADPVKGTFHCYGCGISGKISK